MELNAPGAEDQDDMCVWIHPTDKSLSTIITSDKTANYLFVYDLAGNVLQSVNISGQQPGNIDIRYNFPLGGELVDIVGYNRRSGSTLVFYKVDRTTRQLFLISSFASGANYGFCLYHSPVTQKFYAFSSSESSNMRQYEIADANNDGVIEGTLVREWSNGSAETEGLVADDEMANLYAANENAGVYKYDAEPGGSTSGQLIAAVGSNGLSADVEGVTIYYMANGEGYLLVSSQGSDNFKVYERQEPHTFVKTVSVTGVGDTDGIDVINVSLGTFFPLGLFLIHDGTGLPFRIRGCEWEDLGLEIDTTYWDPTPVELNSFDVNIRDGKAELIWETSSEINNLGFEIQRSENENNFLKIGFVPGYGTTTQNHYYNFIDEENLFGNVAYRLKQIDFDGATEFSETVEVNFPGPNNFILSQNFPNPFNPNTIISIRLPFTVRIRLTVYDITGELVNELASGEYQAGTHQFNFEAENLSSGIYFYRFEGPGFQQTRKMIYIK
jgi:3-phytase